MTTASHNLHSVPLSLRLDPWTPAYESAVQLEEDYGAAPADVDAFVETEDWRPHTPEFVQCPQKIAFIDGVQRVEMRVIGDEDGRMVYGAFASIGIGSVIVRDGACAVEPEAPVRVLALSDGASHERVSVPCGNATLDFEATSTHESGPSAPIQAVQSARRTAEVQLGEALEERGHDMVVVDGRLNWQPKRKAMVIGLVKTLHKQYLQPAQSQVIAKLPPRYRTPIFRIGRDRAAYSWYIRLTEGHPIDHPWSGVVRIETLEAIGIEAAVRTADLTAQHLPEFASSPVHDPRAPQNLYPIGGLEEQLKHALGDHEWIRQHIRVEFSRRYVAP